MLKENGIFCTSCARGYALTAESLCENLKIIPAYVWVITGILAFLLVVVLVILLVVLYYRKKHFLLYRLRVRKVK